MTFNTEANVRNIKFPIGYTDPGEIGLDKNAIVNNTLSNMSLQNSMNMQSNLAAQQTQQVSNPANPNLPIRPVKTDTKQNNYNPNVPLIEEKEEPSQLIRKDENLQAPEYHDVQVDANGNKTLDGQPFIEEENFNEHKPASAIDIEGNDGHILQIADNKNKESFKEKDLKKNFSSDALEDFKKNALPSAMQPNMSDKFLLKKLMQFLADPSSMNQNWFKKSDEQFTTANIPNPSAHIAAAFSVAESDGITNDEALLFTNKLAVDSKRGNPKAGIDYFMITGETNGNKAAEEYAQIMNGTIKKVADGSMTDAEASEVLANAYGNLTKYNGFKSIINDPYFKDVAWYTGGQAAGMALGKGLDIATEKILTKAANKIAGMNNKPANWLKRKIGIAAEEDINKMLKEKAKKNMVDEYEAKNGVIKTPKDPYGAYKPESKLDFKANYIKNTRAGTHSGGSELGGYARDLKVSDKVIKNLPTAEEMDLIDDFIEETLTEHPKMSNENLTEYINTIIKRDPNSKLSKALKKYTDSVYAVMKEDPKGFETKYLENLANESATKGLESATTAEWKGEELLKSKYAGRITGDILWRAGRKIQLEKEKSSGGIEGLGKGYILDKAGNFVDKAGNIIVNVPITMGGAAGREAVKAVRDSMDKDDYKPQDFSAGEEVNVEESPLNPLVKGGDDTNIPYRGPKLEEPLTWEGHEKYRDVYDTLSADIKAAESKGTVSPEEAEDLEKRATMYNSFIRSIQNSPLNDVPGLIDAVEKAQGKVNDYSTARMPKTWIGAYMAGEFGDPKSKDAKRTLRYFALNSLGNALMNMSAVIQKRAPTENQWNISQGEKLSLANKRYDNAKTRAFEANLDSIAKAMNMTLEQKNKVAELINEGDIKLLYDKLSNTKKLDLLERVARFAPYYSKLSDKQRAMMAAIMMDSGISVRDELGMLKANFSDREIAELIGNMKNAEYLNKMYGAKVTQKQVNALNAQIEQALQSAKLTRAQADLYKIKVYAELASHGVESAIRLLEKLIPGGNN